MPRSNLLPSSLQRTPAVNPNFLINRIACGDSEMNRVVVAALKQFIANDDTILIPLED